MLSASACEASKESHAGNLFRRDARRTTAVEKRLPVLRRVFGQRGEVAARVFNGRGQEALEDQVLPVALLRRARVADDVARAGVEQPVIAPARAVREVALLDEEGLEPAQGSIPCDPEAGGPPSDDENLGAEAHRRGSRGRCLLRHFERIVSAGSPPKFDGIPAQGCE